jgi:transcriptional regulator with XRE-family HTH domain
VQNQNPLPKRLKEARAEAGISQKMLGIKVGMDPSSASSRMNHYEKGRHMPDYETLERLAKELGKPVAYFFCESDSIAELLCLLESLPESERQLLIRQLKDSDQMKPDTNCK